MCITDKAKETSSCADLFRCGATSVYLERGVFALPLGWLSLSSACLDATTIPHASGAWSRIFHLMQVCCLPWCPGRPVPCVLRAWLLGVCAWAWPCCVPCLLACLCPCGLVLWGCALPCSLACGPAMPALWAGLVRGPCAWAYYKPLLYGPILRPCIPGLIWASEKGPYFRPDFSAMYFRDFSGLYFRLKISGQIFRVSKSGFFRGDFSGENFPEIFPGFIFRHFFWPDFRDGIWLLLFSRCNIRMIPGSP